MAFRTYIKCDKKGLDFSGVTKLFIIAGDLL